MLLRLLTLLPPSTRSIGVRPAGAAYISAAAVAVALLHAPVCCALQKLVGFAARTAVLRLLPAPLLHLPRCGQAPAGRSKD